MYPLIEGGHIYASVPPLYRFKTGGKNIYIKDDEELASMKNRKGTLTRFKGLGEMSSNDLSETIVMPETRTIKQVTVDDKAAVEQSIRVLMGAEVAPRRQFIIDNAKYGKIDV